MNRLHRLGAAALLALAGACTDRSGPHPTEVMDALRSPGTMPTFQAASAAHARQERLARRLALALSDPAVRLELLATLRASPDPEGKAHFQWLAGASRSRLRSALEVAFADARAELARDLSEGGPLEVYLPVPAHRVTWQGDEQVLVATGITDRDQPVAFDLLGRRMVLDADRPPETPVLALVPAERRFGGAYPIVECDPMADDCEGGGSGTTSPTPVGLVMTYASFTSTFESWLKGKPEFETHVLGQNGTSTELKSYQCAGEHAGGPYVYDQNAKTWSGSVVLFSQAQLDSYRAQHAGQAVRILVLEDDDAACVIKTKQDNLTNLLKAVDQAYGSWTGGRDSTFSLQKYFKKAKALQAIFNAIASLITTNDEIVGTAIEDAVAGQTWPGANWIVRGENNVTNGGIRLEMR